MIRSADLVQHEIARVDELFEFTYSNNENNDTVWPGEYTDWLTSTSFYNSKLLRER